jgi:chemotaxis protein methyltransferase CheR
MRMRWRGFRKVRRQVCKRVGRRIRALELPDIDAYRDYLKAQPDEWDVLDGFCRITISRFYRDRGVFDSLHSQLLPELAARAAKRGDPELGAWCAGCASGEEVYTLRFLWNSDLSIGIVGTDSDPVMLERARAGRYSPGSLKDLPEHLLAAAFEQDGNYHRVRDQFRKGVDFLEQDIRHEMPDGPFDLVLCRNLVFTYYQEPLQAEILSKIRRRMHPGGVLVTGGHERLAPSREFEPWRDGTALYVSC